MRASPAAALLQLQELCIQRLSVFAFSDTQRVGPPLDPLVDDSTTGSRRPGDRRRAHVGALRTTRHKQGYGIMKGSWRMERNTEKETNGGVQHGA
ncbi:hypothetical protein GGTG_05286 [Gaeumannomyces tritici R3-111a-1]|uniref:Uncharacterized protein n=1 Tax=Gaeumannomyces tritici (strain R3-111a-1) TaxID=644352 RepID=J3NVH1_GAET3|nr:hypothetical protein GGTG_05286 [Gaeumannomyces tritici R3-111a-1]EJT75349.1 hypothetical protein GGTG_05286 [Gaeumannomyces tritici R3-111a-1]